MAYHFIAYDDYIRGAKSPLLFQLTIWNMGWIRQEMITMGATTNDAGKELGGPAEAVRPRIPPEHDHGCGIPIVKLLTNDGWHVQPREIEEALQKMQPVPASVSAHLDDDPWMLAIATEVSQQLGAAAVQQARKDAEWTGAARRELWDAWRDFLDECIQKGGFIST